MFLSTNYTSVRWLQSALEHPSPLQSFAQTRTSRSFGAWGGWEETNLNNQTVWHNWALKTVSYRSLLTSVSWGSTQKSPMLASLFQWGLWPCWVAVLAWSPRQLSSWCKVWGRDGRDLIGCTVPLYLDRPLIWSDLVVICILLNLCSEWVNPSSNPMANLLDVS